MKTAILILAFLVGSCAFAARVGDSYDQVIAEKGKPAGQIVAGNARVLNYADVSIRFRDDVVVDIKSIEAARGPATRTDSAMVAKGTDKPSVTSADSDWTVDYRAAMVRARRGHRNVFLFFTGSDWCGWCKRLEAEILSTEEFKNYAKEKLVLVKLDYPKHTEQSEDIRNRNNALATQYKITGFPTVIILSPIGRAMKTLGYQEGGPGPFIDALRSVEQEGQRDLKNAFPSGD